MSQRDYKSQVRAIRIIAIAFVAGLLSFAFIAMMSISKTPSTMEIAETLLIISAVIAVAGILASGILHKLFLKNGLKKASNLRQKLPAYQKATIVRLAFLQAPAIMSLSFLMISGDQRFLMVFFTCFMAFLFAFPKRFKIVNDLSLTEEEERQLD